MIEVIKAKKGLDTLYCIRGLLVIDSLNLFKVNFNFNYTYNKPKILYIFYSEFIYFTLNLYVLL